MQPRSTHGRPILYFVHGAGGHVLRFRQMAHALRETIEVVGVQAIGVEGNEVLDSSLATMVDRYAAAITAQETGHAPEPNESQPCRTVHLGGYSSGGIAAIHLAKRLREMGHTVTSLTLVDSFISEPFPATVSQRVSNVVHNATHRDGLSLLKWATGAIDGWRRRRDWDVEGAAALTKLGYHDVFEAIAETVEQHASPVPVSLPALLIRSTSENPVRRRDYRVVYGSAQKTTTRWIQVKHDELFTDDRSSELAAHIQEFVEGVSLASNAD